MKKIERIMFYGLFIILLIVFSFYDKQIITNMYDPSNMYGKVMGLIGEMPFFWLCSFGGWICFRTRNKNSVGVNISWGVVYAIFALLASIYGGWAFRTYMLRLGWQVELYTSKWSILIPTSIYYLTSCWLALVIDIEDRAKARSWGMMILYLMLWNYVMMMLLKFCWGRPRYRFVMSDANNGTTFVPWYLPHCIGKFDSNYASFPSGHTMMSFGIIALASAGSVFKRNKYKEFIFDNIALGWAIMVAVSRVICGAHYPSDVTFGFFVCLLGYDLMYSFVYPKLLEINRRRLAN